MTRLIFVEYITTCRAKQPFEQNELRKFANKVRKRILRQTNDTISLHDTLLLFVHI